MKFLAAILLFLATVLAMVDAHGYMLQPPIRGGINVDNKRMKGYNALHHSFLGYRAKGYTLTYPCGGYPVGQVTNMKAGEVINVRFGASGMKAADLKRQVPSKGYKKKGSIKQARHGGGFCEFSLSYDNAKTFYTIARYSRTCPDAYHRWKVRIPSNAPSCTTRGQCLFVWTWTASILDQFYMNCADINLRGAKGGKLDKKKHPTIQLFDFKSSKLKTQPRQRIITPGDGEKLWEGMGPNKNEEKMNLRNELPPLPKFTRRP
ncbi:hypothetical protein BGW42_001763 [Actinomortierella wolfii]|nr:hypothetical protein BGW42_001763 [Actinomortierella wolfii]